MKWQYFTCILLLGFARSQASEDDLQDITKSSDKEDVVSEAYNLLVKKCKEIGGDAAIQKLRTSFENTHACLQKHLPKSKDELKDLANTSDDSDDICSSKRHEVRKCFDEVIEGLKACSVDDEKYLPGFIFNGIDGILNYLCANDGAAIEKTLTDNTFECVFKLMEFENITDICTDQMKVLKDDTPEDIIVTKTELCHDLDTIKTCYGAVLVEHCPKSPEFREFLKGLHEAITASCHTDT